MITKLPMKGADNIYLQVKHGIALKDEPNEDALKSALLFVFALLGLKHNSFPTELEKPVLHNTIIEKFGDITAEEIRIAYKMAVNGELFEDNKPINLKLYGDVYSFDHFARVLRAYRIQKRNEIKTLVSSELHNTEEVPSVERRAEIRREYVEKSIIEPLKRFAGGTINELEFGTLSPLEVFKQFWKAGMINSTNEERILMYRKHKQEVKAEYEAKSKQPSTSPEEYLMKQLMNEALSGKNNNIENEVQKRCSIEELKKAIEVYSIETIFENLLKL